VPRDVLSQQEPQPDSPQEEEPFEIVVTIPQGKTHKKLNRCRSTMTMTSKRKKTMRKKKKVATRLKAKKMKTTLLGATPRRTRHSMMPTRTNLLEMRPRSPLAD
jgi:hypothetical protein